MKINGQNSCYVRLHRYLPVLAAVCLLFTTGAHAQSLTGALIGTVRDPQGAIVPGAVVQATSPALMGGPATMTTNEKGQLRFPVLPPGGYAIEITMPGFEKYREEGIQIGAGATVDRMVVLTLAGVAQSVVVEGTGSRIDARNPGVATRFALEDIRTIPTRRSSMFDFMRAAPGISATSPSSGTVTTVSAFGSGANENAFLIDGTNFTCPCIGIARSEPGVDFIQEIQVQSVGASAEFGNIQGAVINVITRQGGDRFLGDASYYWQTSGLTSQPVRFLVPNSNQVESGYERTRYRDVTTNLGGPAVRDRAWFFAGYQHLRDYDSQPGTDPAFPRTYKQDKVFGKLTWRPAPGWQLFHSIHDEHWVNPEPPTIARPYDATRRMSASVPAVTFGHLTHSLSSNTVWEARAGQFVYSEDNRPSTGSLTTPGRTDSVTRLASGAPQSFGSVRIVRTSAKATLSHYRPALLGADHEWKMGGQFEKGEHRIRNVIPTSQRFVDNNGLLSQIISRAPATFGGISFTSSAFVSDAVTIGDRITLNAGLRFDHSRAGSQDLPAIDLEGRETRQIIPGRGRLYTWNLFSPRLGVTTKLAADGRTILRASYGRFYQGVLTGELDYFHPGATPITTTEVATGAVRVEDPNTNLRFDPDTRAPRTDEYSVGIDRQVGGALTVAIAYIRKDGSNFIGWSDVAGQYRPDTRRLADDEIVPVFLLDTAVTSPAARRFLLTNQDAYSMTYNGLMMAVEKRRAHGWQAFGSYTLSRAYGLQGASATTAAGAQTSTVAPGGTFGRDPNDLSNALGRLPNDRPHIFRLMGSVDVPRTGFAIAANLQHVSGKPWAATTIVNLPQNSQQRVQLEPRGSRRLSSQTPLDLRVSRSIRSGSGARIDLLLDVLNVLNDTAEEGLVTDTLATQALKSVADFGKPNAFVDPRRAMVGVRINLGR
jgi:hypothetical protein